MYDIAILGGGPAGITASIYAARYKLKTVLISPEIGGWSAKAHMIQNMPSHVSVLGKDLKNLYTEHVKANDIDYKKGRVTGIEEGFKVITNEETIEAKYIVYALGTKKRKLGIPGEDELLGKGVCLCATCDAPFFRSKNVAVIGGNDSGTTSALLIAEYADKVTIVELLDKLPTEPVWMEQIDKNPKIDVITSESVKEIKGDSVVKSILLSSGKELSVDGVFIEVGSIPDTGIVDQMKPKLDKWGHLMVDKQQMTSIDKLYAAGDITDGSNYMRQIVAAQAEGAIAAQDIYKKTMRNKK